MGQVNLLINEDLEKRLEFFCSNTGISKSFVFRKGAEEFLDKKENSIREEQENGQSEK